MDGGQLGFLSARGFEKGNGPERKNSDEEKEEDDEDDNCLRREGVDDGLERGRGVGWKGVNDGRRAETNCH